MDTETPEICLKDIRSHAAACLDIRSNGTYPANVLSNLCSNGFRFDGMVCGSMEGFLQSLKRQDIDKQRQICSMKGGHARKMSVTSWQTDQIVWWKGLAIDRQSYDFQCLIRQAYKAMFCQNERFRTALMQTRGMTLVHSVDEENSYRTILTPTEFCGILTEMRDNYDRRDKTQELIEKSKDAAVSLSVNKKILYLHNGSDADVCQMQQTLNSLLPNFDIALCNTAADSAETLSNLRNLYSYWRPDIIIGNGFDDNAVIELLAPLLSQLA